MRKCSIENCDSVHEAKGYCRKHYSRLKKTGSTDEPYSQKASHYLYATHKRMRQRCQNTNDPYYSYYGGRGIKVCDRWLGKDGFDNFIHDMGERPDGYSLDRIDNNGGYEPDNCRWATKTVQAINQRISSNNTTGSKGIYLSKKWGRWQAYIHVNGRRKHLGYFAEKQDAITARVAAELERDKLLS